MTDVTVFLEQHGVNKTADTLDEFLAHYGVKGMKWGERKAKFQRNRALNKNFKEATKAAARGDFEAKRVSLRPSTPKTFDTSTKEGRQAYRQARAADIDRARERVRSGAWAADNKAAKQQYKQDKINLGSKAARKALKDSRNKLNADLAKSKEVRDGGELVAALLGGLAAQRLKAARS